MIDENGTWYVGVTKPEHNASTSYNAAKQITWTGAVGIMATFEFMYASNGSGCYSVGGGSYASSCGGAAYDWLKPESHDAWTLSPYYYDAAQTRGVPLNISPSGYVSASSSEAASLWIYPSVYLKDNTKIVGGTGTRSDPYVLETYNPYTITIPDSEENGSVEVNVDDLTEVEYDTEVKFKITPKKGYKVSGVVITDNNGEEVDFEPIENENEYIFTMPKSNVTITPSYEVVKRAIIIEQNENTEDINAGDCDVLGVVYGTNVILKVVPKEDYEVERLDITDEEKNEIEYTKTENENEYEFTMPDTDVYVKAVTKKIESAPAENPNTSDKMILFLIVMIGCLASGAYFWYKKKVLTAK
jgi:hypothetical protein